MILSKKAAAIFFAAAFFIADRLLKILFAGYLSGQFFSLLGQWLSLRLAFNRGIAFSLPLPLALTLSLSLTVLVLLFYLLVKSFKAYKSLEFWGLILLFTGAASNWLDRLKWSAVVDYFDLKYFTIFNLADILIVVGIFLLILSFRQKKYL